MTATATQLQQLYIAYFGRAADPEGIDYWINAGTTVKQFAAHMDCLLYTSPSPRDGLLSRMPSSA